MCTSIGEIARGVRRSVLGVLWIPGVQSLTAACCAAGGSLSKNRNGLVSGLAESARDVRGPGRSVA